MQAAGKLPEMLQDVAMAEQTVSFGVKRTRLIKAVGLYRYINTWKWRVRHCRGLGASPSGQCVWCSVSGT